MKTILGIDPGLQKTGWGVLTHHHNQLRFVGCGVIKPPVSLPLAERLLVLNRDLATLIAEYQPHIAALEETFVNNNGASTLKLGQARGAILLSLSLGGLAVHEYSATQVKKTVTGSGRADKTQIARMVHMLLPQAREVLTGVGNDATDALAVAICHSQHSHIKSLV